MGNTTEGELDFDVPAAGKPCKTWYKIFGDLTSGKTPLLLLHGGPGACHEYVLPITDLTKRHNIPVVVYDQLGNGKSTRLREKNGDATFWTPDLFMSEIDNLIDHLGLRESGYSLLGQSWGGMLAAQYATHRPKGLRKLIISNSPAAMHLWCEAAQKLRKAMPDVDRVLSKHEKDGTTDNPEYAAATMEFYKVHLCRVVPFPACVQAAMDHLEEDPTVYGTMNRPNEFYVIGTLKDWDITERLGRIEVEATLLVNGEFDEAMDSTVLPYFRGIGGKVRWRTVSGASHMCHVERPEEYLELVGGFLEG